MDGLSNYVRALLQAGRVVEARRLWDTAQSIWARYHVAEDTFELLALQRLASGVTREQLLPSHVCGVLDRLAMCRDVITMQEFYELWRTWQMGYCTWREPWTGCGGVVRTDDHLRVGAATSIMGAVAVEEAWILGHADCPKVPRMPPMEAVGRREHWLALHPQSMRSWAIGAIGYAGSGATTPAGEGTNSQ